MNVGPPMCLACTVTQPSGWMGIRTSRLASSTVVPRCTQTSPGLILRSSLLVTSCVSRTMTSQKSLLVNTRHDWPTLPSRDPWPGRRAGAVPVDGVDARKEFPAAPGAPSGVCCVDRGPAMLVPERPAPPGPPGTAAGPAMPGMRAQCSRGVPVDPPAAGRAGGGAPVVPLADGRAGGCVPIPPPVCWLGSALSCFACGCCGAGGCCLAAVRGGIGPLAGPRSRCCSVSGLAPPTLLSADKNWRFWLLLPLGPAPPGPEGPPAAGSDTCSARGGIPTPGRIEMLGGIGVGYPGPLSEVGPTPDACIGGIGPMGPKPLPAALPPGGAIEGLAIPIQWPEEGGGGPAPGAGPIDGV